MKNTAPDRRRFLAAATSSALIGLAGAVASAQPTSAPGWWSRFSPAVAAAAEADMIRLFNGIGANSATQQDALVAARSVEVLYAHLNEIGANDELTALLKGDRRSLASTRYTSSDVQRLEAKARSRGLIIRGPELSLLQSFGPERQLEALDLVAVRGVHSIQMALVDRIRASAATLPISNPGTQILADRQGGRFRLVVDPTCAELWAALAIAGMQSGLWTAACFIVPIECIPALFYDTAGAIILGYLWWYGCL